MKKVRSKSDHLDETAFAKARYDYCFQLYKSEQERKDAIEKKAQFYLSLVTLFLGAIVLKLDFLKDSVGMLPKNLPPDLTTILYIAGGTFLVSLSISLMSILFSVHVRNYLIEHPADLTSALFSSTSEYLGENTVAELYTSTAMSYALATESDRIINERKSTWIRLSSFFLLVAFLAFVMVFGMIVFLRTQ